MKGKKHHLEKGPQSCGSRFLRSNDDEVRETIAWLAFRKDLTVTRVIARILKYNGSHFDSEVKNVNRQ